MIQMFPAAKSPDRQYNKAQDTMATAVSRQCSTVPCPTPCGPKVLSKADSLSQQQLNLQHSPLCLHSGPQGSTTQPLELAPLPLHSQPMSCYRTQLALHESVPLSSGMSSAGFPFTSPVRRWAGLTLKLLLKPLLQLCPWHPHPFPQKGDSHQQWMASKKSWAIHLLPLRESSALHISLTTSLYVDIYKHNF